LGILINPFNAPFCDTTASTFEAIVEIGELEIQEFLYQAAIVTALAYEIGKEELFERSMMYRVWCITKSLFNE
jgi:hypothetical protein